MITREDLKRAERCTGWTGCPEHLGFDGHGQWEHIDLDVEAYEWADIGESLELAMSDAWDADSTMSEIAGRWIKHMAATHGAHCAGPHCEATADTPAYVGALRRMWRQIGPQLGAQHFREGARQALSDLAHELGVDLYG